MLRLGLYSIIGILVFLVQHQVKGISCPKYCDQHCYRKQRNKLICDCFKGFKLNQNGRTCDDADECKESWPCQQLCINTHGSFMCQCRDGYIINPDGKSCNDIDECKHPSVCFHDTELTCVNLPGSYVCLRGLDKMFPLSKNGTRIFQPIVKSYKSVRISGLRPEGAYPLGMTSKQVERAIVIFGCAILVLIIFILAFLMLFVRHYRRPKSAAKLSDPTETETVYSRTSRAATVPSIKRTTRPQYLPPVTSPPYQPPARPTQVPVDGRCKYVTNVDVVRAKSPGTLAPRSIRENPAYYKKSPQSEEVCVVAKVSDIIERTAL